MMKYIFSTARLYFEESSLAEVIWTHFLLIIHNNVSIMLQNVFLIPPGDTDSAHACNKSILIIVIYVIKE